MMTRSICLAFLAVLAIGARVDEEPKVEVEAEAAEVPEEDAQKSGGEAKKKIARGEYDADDPDRKPRWFCEKEVVRDPTALESAERDHREAVAGHEKAKKHYEHADAHHAQATDKEDMSYVMSVIKKSAAIEQGGKAQQAQVDQTSATQKRQTSAEKLKYAKQHEDEASRLSTLHKEEADKAIERKKEADATLKDTKIKARYTKEQHELAAKAAEDSQAAADTAHERAEKARDWKAESAKIRDEAEQNKIARTEEAHTAAKEAVYAVHAHYMANEHLKKVKKQAAKAKVDLVVATKAKKDAKLKEVEAKVMEKKADVRAKESAWSASGSVDRLGTDTAAALSAFSDKVASQKEGELRVRKHTEARTAMKAAHAAVLSAAREKQEADAEVADSVEQLPSPDTLALVNPKGDLAKKVATDMASQLPADDDEASADAGNATA